MKLKQIGVKQVDEFFYLAVDGEVLTDQQAASVLAIPCFVYQNIIQKNGIPGKQGATCFQAKEDAYYAAVAVKACLSLICLQQIRGNFSQSKKARGKKAKMDAGQLQLQF